MPKAIKFICSECTYIKEDDGFCNIKSVKTTSETSMCREGIEEKIRRGNELLEKYRKDKNKKNEDILLKRIIQYQKKLAELTEKDIEKAEEDSIKFHKVPIQLISKSKYYNKDIQIDCVLMGKDYESYIIPKRIIASCKSLNRIMQRCALCPLYKKEKKFEINYLKHRDIILDMIDITSNQLIGIIRKNLILPKCININLNIVEEQNIEMLQVIPELQSEMIDYQYTIKRALFMGEGLETNLSYNMQGTTLPDSKNQLALFLVKNAIKSEDDISNFKLTKDIKEKLKKFQLEKGQSISEKLNEIYEDFTHTVEPRIYGRKNLHFAVDLAYHSVLSFNFLDEFVNRGWIEVLLIGDTRCGKTELVKKMVKHYGIGEFVTSGENTSFAGLVGGVQQTGKHWMLNWGKWILNNRRLIVIDEADGIEPDMLGKLSGLRSSGIAEIVKMGQKEKTMAKTRVIWITNPKRGNLKRYSFGIQSIKEIFHRLQDISRLDFVVGVAKDDVPIDVINKKYHKTTMRQKYKKDLCHSLVMFAWSRKPDNIKFTEETEDFILKKSIELDKMYSYNIPLVTGAEMRIKLAKMGIALACRLYSVDKSSENIVVEKQHIKFIVDYLNQEYSRNCLDYLSYSDQKRQENSISDKHKLQELIDWDIEKISLFLNLNQYTIGDIQDILETGSKTETKGFITRFVKLRALRKSRTYYIKTPAFIEWLKDLKSKIAKDKDEVFF